MEKKYWRINFNESCIWNLIKSIVNKNIKLGGDLRVNFNSNTSGEQVRVIKLYKCYTIRSEKSVLWSYIWGIADKCVKKNVIRHVR